MSYEVTYEVDAKWRIAANEHIYVYRLKVPPQEFSPIHHTQTHSMATQGVFEQKPLLSAARQLAGSEESTRRE